MKIYFRWEHMSTIGSYYSGRLLLEELAIPKYHKGTNKPYMPGPKDRVHNY